MEEDEKLQECGAENQRKMESDDESDYEECVPSTSATPSKKTKPENGPDSLAVLKDAVVVIKRIPEYKIDAMRPPTPPQFYSEDESLSSSDSNMCWDEDGDSSSRNLCRRPVACSSNTNGTKVRPNLPEEPINLEMRVVARKGYMKWLRGKIVDTVRKVDGRLRYKVSFDEKGRSLMSAHHFASDSTPRLEQLYVGARVVVSRHRNSSVYRPGILVEFPSRKNRLRFLVFQDNHVPRYVGLPDFHMVCRPLANVLDDIQSLRHRAFMRQYLSDWPYPRLTQHKPGATLNVELGGVQQSCKVELVNCSLMQVVFLHNQRREWIFRGSMRLGCMELFFHRRMLEEQVDD